MWSVVGEWMWVAFAAVAAIFVSIGYLGRNIAVRVGGIVIPVGLAIWDLWLVSSTGKGLKENAVCYFVPTSVDCSASREPLVKIPAPSAPPNVDCASICFTWREAGWFSSRGVWRLSNGEEKLVRAFPSQPLYAISPGRNRAAVAESKRITILSAEPENETVLDFHQPLGSIEFSMLRWVDDNTLHFRAKASLESFNINRTTFVYQRSVASTVPSWVAMDKLEVDDISDTLFVHLCDDGSICQIGKVERRLKVPR